MLFTSYEFILFLLILLVVYYLVPKRIQYLCLLVGNFVFYYFAGIESFAFILFTILSTYGATSLIQKNFDKESQFLHETKLERNEKKLYRSKKKKQRTILFVLCLCINLSILAVTKYTNFVIHSINDIFSFGETTKEISFVNMIVPLGISFYTFQTMGYLIDVYWGKIKAEKNLLKLACFVSFFPQLIQGPISRFDALQSSLVGKHEFSTKNIWFGIERILWGYFKKLVIADRILVAVKTIISAPEQYSGSYVFLGIVFYAIELYCDFTGGIDITIGIAKLFGITVEENFIRPYFSKNIAEYWRRWHISMGTWFRDYIFYPISMSVPMLNLSKNARKYLGNGVGKRVTVYIATIVTWLATGIWHGANWYFIVWGLMNCFVLIVSQELEPLYQHFHKAFPKLVTSKPYMAFQILRTFLLMCAIRMFDCYQGVALTFQMFFRMFVDFSFSTFFDGSLLTLGLSKQDYLILFFGTGIVFLVSLFSRDKRIQQKLLDKPKMLRYGLSYGMLLAILLFGIYGSSYDASQFIYNQF